MILSLLIAGAITTAQPTSAWKEVNGLAMSKEGYQLVLDFEVGGGKVYYVRQLQRPTVPPAASGVTIGVGYDLGYHTREQIARDWHMLPRGEVALLQRCAGLTRSAARLRLAEVRHIVIPWEAALQVFEETTMSRFAALTLRAYPGTEKLHPHIQASMFSWTFNRGNGISATSSRDREKRALRADIPDRPDRLPSHFRSSMRLWPGIYGLLRRREAEAKLVERGIREGPYLSKRY